MASKHRTRPRPLAPGDLIRVIAPASPFKKEALLAGVAALESWGYRVAHRDDLFDRRDYFAGTPARRAAELHEAFEDPDCRAILPVRGGYGLTTLLPLLDADRIAAHPTALVGCSDLTALLNWLVDRAGMTCVHGPMVGALGAGGDPEGAERLKAVLQGGKAGALSSFFDDPLQWCVAPGAAKGEAVGGSLSLIAAGCGTPWQLDTRGRVLFLEDVAERPYRIDRMLVQLEQAGLFDEVAAVVLGDFVGCDEPGGELTWRDAAVRVFRRLPIPVLAGLRFGHGSPNLAIPLGVPCEVDSGRGSVRFRRAPFA